MSHVFLSYKHANQNMVDEIKARLEDAGIEVWTDKQIRPGEQWRDVIDKSIKSCFAVIIVMTPIARLSEFVTYEWAFAMGLDKLVIPVVFEAMELHPKLETIQHLDFTTRYREPWDALIDLLRENQHIQESNETASNPNGLISQLLSDLQIDDVHTQHVAANQLIELNNPESIPLLLRLLNHRNEWTRGHVCYVLGKIGDFSIIPVLTKTLKEDREFSVRGDAAEALGEIGDIRAEDGLIDALLDHTSSVKGKSLKALGLIKSQKSASAVRKLLYHDSDIRGSAAETLGKLRDAYAIPIIIKNCLTYPDNYVRAKGAEAIGKIAGDAAIAAVPALITLLNDSEIWLGTETRVSDEAARALINIGTEEALEAVESWRKNQQPL